MFLSDSFLHKESFAWELAEEPTYKPDYVKLVSYSSAKLLFKRLASSAKLLF